MKPEGFLIFNNNSNIRVRSGYTLQSNLADIFIYDIGDDLGLYNWDNLVIAELCLCSWVILFSILPLKLE